MMSSGKNEFFYSFSLTNSQVNYEYSMRSVLWKIQNGFWELIEKNIWKKLFMNMPCDLK